MSWIQLSASQPTARKDHQCQLCEWPIPAGTIYIKSVGIFEDDMWTYRAHPICQAVLDVIDDLGTSQDEGTPLPGGFRQLLAHVITLEMVPRQPPPGFKADLKMPPGEFTWDSWDHLLEDCLVCPDGGQAIP